MADSTVLSSTPHRQVVLSSLGLNFKNHQELVHVAYRVLKVLGYREINEDCWSRWWGLYYLHGWCFEASDSSRRSITIRLIKIGTYVDDLPFAAAPSSIRGGIEGQQNFGSCREMLKEYDLDFQVFHGSMIHSLLLDMTSKVIQSRDLEKDFIIESRCPPTNLRFWRVEAVALRYSRRIVYIECSSSFSTREQADPINHACSVLEVIEDPLGQNHLFVLDIVDMTNERDKDGRTSLIRYNHSSTNYIFAYQENV